MDSHPYRDPSEPPPERPRPSAKFVLLVVALMVALAWLMFGGGGRGIPADKFYPGFHRSSGR